MYLKLQKHQMNKNDGDLAQTIISFIKLHVRVGHVQEGRTLGGGGGGGRGQGRSFPTNKIKRLKLLLSFQIY